LPLPPPGDLPDPGIKPESPVSPALADRFFTTEPPGKFSLTRIKYVKHDRWINYVRLGKRFNFLNIGHHAAF